MQEPEDTPAPGPTRTRLDDEIRETIEGWELRDDQTRLELAWRVTRELMDHVQRNHPFDVYVEFCAKAADIMGEQAEMGGAILKGDFKLKWN